VTVAEGGGADVIVDEDTLARLSLAQ
jgi:hypothetical protein